MWSRTFRARQYLFCPVAFSRIYVVWRTHLAASPILSHADTLSQHVHTSQKGSSIITCGSGTLVTGNIEGSSSSISGKQPTPGRLVALSVVLQVAPNRVFSGSCRQSKQEAYQVHRVQTSPSKPSVVVVEHARITLCGIGTGTYCCSTSVSWHYQSTVQ